MIAFRHNLVHLKNPKKRPSTARSDFEQNNFFVDLHTPGLTQKNSLACSGLVLGLISTNEV